jgi:hypothetical protein
MPGRTRKLDLHHMSSPASAQQPKSNFTADPCFKLRQTSLDCLADNGGQPAACKEFVELRSPDLPGFLNVSNRLRKTFGEERHLI